MNRSLTPARSARSFAGTFVLGAAAAAISALAPDAARGTDLHFDYTSFDNPGTPTANPHFGTAQFNVLGYPSINGNYFMTSTDTHRPEMVANGNTLAEFYNFVQARYDEQTVKDGAAAAVKMHTYTVANSARNGPRPDWIVLNEISTSGWQNSAAYRQWIIDVAATLKGTYNYNVIAYSPFATVGTSNAASWQALSANASIGIENYLSGEEVLNGGADTNARKAFAQAQYQASKNTYTAVGVDFSKLFMSEHFGNTVAGTLWGRAGLSADDWDSVIQIRQDAIKAIGFPGFLGYSWGSNPMNTMGVTEAEMIQHEYWYRTRLVLPGQQPQWLSDSSPNVNGTIIPLSWSEQLNWIGGVPNANGAVANFYKTLTTNRTVTLDGSKTVGTLTFNSDFTYTVAPGTGGTLTFNNSGAAAPLIVSGGSAIISTAIQLSDALNVNLVNGSNNLTFAGALANTAGKAITKSGGGTLYVSGAQTHGAGASLNAAGGSVILNTDVGSGSLKNLSVNVSSRITANTTQHLKSATITNGNFTLSANSNRYLHTAGLSITGAAGKLDLNDNDLVVEYAGASPFSQIQQWILDGYSVAPDTAKIGIISTHGQSQGGNTILALFDNALAGFTEWPAGSGNSVAAESVLGKYTYIGDTNMDGQVTAQDYTAIDANLGTTVDSAISWFYGDTNFDGNIDATDYTGVDAALGLGQGNPLSTTAIPEPAAFALLPAGYLLFKRRRRHFNSTRP